MLHFHCMIIWPRLLEMAWVAIFHIFLWEIAMSDRDTPCKCLSTSMSKNLNLLLQIAHFIYVINALRSGHIRRIFLLFVLTNISSNVFLLGFSNSYISARFCFPYAMHWKTGLLGKKTRKILRGSHYSMQLF